MALWKDNVKPASPPSSTPSFLADAMQQPARTEAPSIAEPKSEAAATPVAARAPVRDKPRSESLIAPDIAIEGKIEGAGHVRIAGRFKGDVNVRGDLTIEPGATVSGSVRAEKVTIAGELGGNIEAASHVDLLQSGSLTGDLKAATLTVAAGSRMRGQVDFGWEDAKSPEIGKNGAQRNGADHGNLS
ncbi:MAG TPA: polymer-forming cytoskeletal protein [Rhodanobacteraceae bacterium]|jgi:cytoskeletal protein CcmA (bactofilin family)|nr:polymer-forming cytoskeletal protein [Rhodanobacteraceae bacterium]